MSPFSLQTELGIPIVRDRAVLQLVANFGMVTLNPLLAGLQIARVRLTRVFV